MVFKDCKEALNKGFKNVYVVFDMKDEYNPELVQVSSTYKEAWLTAKSLKAYQIVERKHANKWAWVEYELDRRG